MSRRGLLEDGPADAPVVLALAHGAGAGMEHPFLETVAGALAGRGVRVVRFEFPYMQRRRAAAAGGRKAAGPPDRQPVLLDAWRRLIGELRPGAPRLAIGGKSMGGRIASMVADEAGIDGLVCLGYPFHPPGRPERTRTAHLAALDTPTLVVQGTRDPFGRPEEVAGYALSPAIRIVWIDDGDHSFVPRKSSGRSAEQNLATAIDAVAAFLTELARAG